MPKRSTLALRRLLEHALVPHKSLQEELLKGDGAPLGSFSARTKVAFGIGLLERHEHTNLFHIRKIRNIAAHDPDEFSFDQEEVMKTNPYDGAFDKPGADRFKNLVVRHTSDLRSRAASLHGFEIRPTRADLARLRKIIDPVPGEDRTRRGAFPKFERGGWRWTS